MTAAVTSISPAISRAIAAAMPVAVLRELPLDELVPNPNNPRRTVDAADIRELAASIREHGVQVPLIVRPDPEFANNDSESRFEIVAGHRRYQAARLAGRAGVPCLVRQLDDAAAAEVALVDNLQRVDVPPMEEAEAFGDLLDRLLSIAAVAAKVGKEVAYVAKALKLRSLTEASRLALNERLITIDHARLLCRLAEAEQNEALKWCLSPMAGVKVGVEDVITKLLDQHKIDEEELHEEDEGKPSRTSHWDHSFEPQTVQRLKERIESESGTTLDRAPWPMDEDWLIPDAGSCLDCEKNTKANAPLFGDLDTGIAVCTDGGCFKAKTQSFVQIELKKHSAEKLPALSLSWKSTSTPPRLDKETGLPTLKQVFKYGQWLDVGSKGTACWDTRPGITVDWSEGSNNKLRKPGEMIQVCIQPKCKVHKKAYEKQGASEAGGAPRESYEQRLAREKKELEPFKLCELPVRRALFDAIATKMTGDQIKRMVLRSDMDADPTGGISFVTNFASDEWRERAKHVHALVQKAKGPELDRLLIAAMIGRELEIDYHHMSSPDKGRGDLRKVAKELGLDPAAIEREAEKALIPPRLSKAAVKAAKTAFDAAAKDGNAKRPKVLPPGKKPAKKAAKKPATKKKGGAK